MRPDETIDVRGSSSARCSLWWSATPSLNGKRVGFIGHYESSGDDAAQELLMRATQCLADEGCDVAIGPVDGDTWHSYRFLTERGTRARFFLEPDNPDCYPSHFRAAGFEPIAHFVSAEEERLGEHSDPRVERAKRRLLASGVRIRSFDVARYDDEIEAIHLIACASFERNLLFTPISLGDFRALYAPLRTLVDPDFVRLAEFEGRPVGFAFGIVDPNDPTTLVGKTQAHLPDFRFSGLGAVMLDDVRCTAHQRGLRRIVHALIRDNNVALNASARVATPFRRYMLFGSALR